MKIAVFSISENEQPYFAEIARSEELQLVVAEKIPLTLESTKLIPSGTDIVSITPVGYTTKAILEKLQIKQVRVLATRSSGIDAIDLEAAQELGIKIVNVESYSPQAIAEFTLMQILGSLRRMKEMTQSMGTGNFAGGQFIAPQLNTRVVGIMGYGHIGKCVAKLLGAFKASIVVYSPSVKQFTSEPSYITFTSDLADFLRQIDILTLHCPLNEQTHHIVNQAYLELLRPGAIIVNMARGGLVDTEVLLEKLDSEHIAFYATDVYEFEQTIFQRRFASVDMIEDELFKRLYFHRHVSITPHIAFNTYTSIENIVKYSVNNAIAALK